MISISFSLTSIVGRSGGPRPPAGYVFLTDADGTLLKDADGAYLEELA